MRGKPERSANLIAAHALGFIGHRAGIQDKQIGRLTVFHDIIALRLQPIGKDRRFRLIQATPDGM
jgi:hypothetical protein